MSRSTQFRPHAIGVKTARMLEVERRLGRSLAEDFEEYYVQKRWGQKRMAKRWGVTRAAIFGRGETMDLKCWVQVLQLPVRREPASPAQAGKSTPACEICAVRNVPLEAAHWIPRSKGGDADPSNILNLCPNCHKKLDLLEDPTLIAHARAALLVRVARRFTESAASSRREQQLEFVARCKAIIERRGSHDA